MSSENNKRCSFDKTLEEVKKLDLPFERDIFLRELIRHLAGSLQDVIGLEEASGFISIVGQTMGEKINTMYKGALQVEELSKDQVKSVLIDLKKRIQGDFYIIEETEEKIVFGNNVCPFADKVLDRPAMCMMTSNVFGSIAAENLGYAKVTIEKAIALGHEGCKVVLYLKPNNSVEGREYFKGS